MTTNTPRYGIFDSDTQQLVEGGFFNRHYAEESAAQWNASAQADGDAKNYYVARQDGSKAGQS